MAERDIENDIQSLREDMAALRSDLSKITDDMKKLGRNRAESAKEGLSDTAHGLRDEIRRVINETGSKGKKSIETVESEIGERPFTSLLISFGAGLLIAKLLERK